MFKVADISGKCQPLIWFGKSKNVFLYSKPTKAACIFAVVQLAGRFPSTWWAKFSRCSICISLSHYHTFILSHFRLSHYHSITLSYFTLLHYYYHSITLSPTSCPDARSSFFFSCKDKCDKVKLQFISILDEDDDTNPKIVNVIPTVFEPARQKPNIAICLGHTQRICLVRGKMGHIQGK